MRMDLRAHSLKFNAFDALKHQFERMSASLDGEPESVRLGLLGI